MAHFRWRFLHRWIMTETHDVFEHNPDEMQAYRRFASHPPDLLHCSTVLYHHGNGIEKMLRTLSAFAALLGPDVYINNFLLSVIEPRISEARTACSFG